MNIYLYYEYLWMTIWMKFNNWLMKHGSNENAPQSQNYNFTTDNQAYSCFGSLDLLSYFSYKTSKL